MLPGTENPLQTVLYLLTLLLQLGNKKLSGLSNNNIKRLQSENLLKQEVFLHALQLVLHRSGDYSTIYAEANRHFNE